MDIGNLLSRFFSLVNQPPSYAPSARPLVL